MKASQNLPGVLPYAVCCDSGPAPGSGAGQPNLVIVNLAELAAADVPAAGLCFADCAAPPAPGHDGHRSSSWILPTAR